MQKIDFRSRNIKLIILTSLIIFVLACNFVTGDGDPQDGPALANTLAASTPGEQVFPTTIPSTVQPPAADPFVFVTPTQEIYHAPDQSGLDINCDGARTDVPCEPRRIRIRGFDNPTSVGAPVAGQSYGWFAPEGIPWVIAVHAGVGPQGFPVGFAFDSGTLMQFQREENGYYYVVHPEYPGILFTLSTSEVTSQTKPSASYFMKSVPTKWCPVNPADPTHTMITLGETYVWFGLGYSVQFNYFELYPNAAELMALGAEPDVVSNGGTLLPVQDFEPAKLLNTTANGKPWLEYDGQIVYAPNSFCNYWADGAP